MLHDPRLATVTRRARSRELGIDGIAIRMLAGFVFGLILVELIGRLTGHPGVVLLLGWAR